MLIVSLKIRNLLAFKSLIKHVDYFYISIVISLQICLLLQLFYVLVIHRKLASFRGIEPGTQLKLPISVIICARNEIENLKKNLVPILTQNYPDFEVIVVNDCSNDGSDLFLRDLSVKYKNLKVVSILEHPRFKHGKSLQ